MRTYQGKSVYPGVAVGRIRLYGKTAQTVKRIRIRDDRQEVLRFHTAKREAEAELEKLYQKACAEVGHDHAAIFEIHRMMLEDADYIDAVEHILRSQKVNAEYAVAVTAENFAEMFSGMESAYMQARAADVRDVSDRLLRILNGGAESLFREDEPMILLAEDLAPSETVQLDKSKVLAFVTVRGAVNSHTAILARSMGIPAVIRAEMPMDASVDGKTAIVDGEAGLIYIEPSPDFLEKMTQKKKKEEEQKKLLLALKGERSVTQDGKEIRLYANIGNSKDLALVLENDAEGIGLFRSEFIYLEREDFPSEDEQFKIYRTVAETMAGKQVIVRTLDIGADKQAPYFAIDTEENPAMGLRAIRICLTRPEIFQTQLRALFRAACYGEIAVMYPMITSIYEMDRIEEIVQTVEESLKQEGIPYQRPKTGIMIETPAAVMMADQLAQRVDFFSIGTNDLSQYTLAMDRQNERLDPFFEPYSEAVMRMIAMTVKYAHQAGIWVGICGELGADTAVTERLLKMGIDELSVSPSRVLPVRAVIRQTRCGESHAPTA